MASSQENAVEMLRAMVDKKCWYVSHGGCTSPSFELVMGAKIPRRSIVQNMEHPKEFRLFEGESNLLVWCTWRLDGIEQPIASADDSEEDIGRALALLVGTTVLNVKHELPGWDLIISFSGSLQLKVLSDYIGAGSSFSVNWELAQTDYTVVIERGCTLSLEPRYQ